MRSEHDDHRKYYKFTGPQRLDKAMHTLDGIVQGVSSDSRVSDKELRALTGWIGEHMEFAKRHPFNEVIPRLNSILADGIVDDEEKADVLWICNKFSTDEEFFSAVSADMQRLQGFMGGIAADGVISGVEIERLREWMQHHEHLKTCWPYDELESVITSVLQDGVLDETEQQGLLAFFSEFIDYPGHRTLNLPIGPEGGMISGICSVCPEIVFRSNTFCFTGSSKRGARKELAAIVEHLGGLHSPRINREVNYLVVGADGNPCWAFACYGRKVESAVELRKQGHKIQLVHEHDFFDAVQDEGYRL